MCIGLVYVDEEMCHGDRLTWAFILYLGFFPPFFLAVFPTLSARSSRLTPAILAAATLIVNTILSLLSSACLGCAFMLCLLDNKTWHTSEE